MEEQRYATNQMIYLGIALGVAGVFFLTGIVPVVQAAQGMVGHMLSALGL